MSTSEITTTSRNTKFDVLEPIEGELEIEEVNAVDVVQESVEVTVALGVA